jgi:Fur family ferric uptake transcriptional regulator
MTPESLPDTLKRRGHKLTRQRKAVLDLFSHANGHLTPQQVCARVKRKYPRVGLATVYRTLDLLHDLGVVCRLAHPDGGHTYTLAASGHHHHLLCTACGTVVDFTTSSLDELQQRLALESGFTIESHTLEFAGRCPDCKNQLSSSNANNSQKGT